MSLTQHDLERLLEPSYLGGLESASVARLRAFRDEFQHAEVILSYLRRVIQGELDLVAGEMAVRASNGRSDVGRLVEELPTILALSGVTSERPAHESVPTMTAVADATIEQLDLPIEDLLNGLFPLDLAESLPGGLLPGANLCTLADDELVKTLARLQQEESSLSAQRHQLHDGIDEIQAAIVERYKSGAADPDSLLR